MSNSQTTESQIEEMKDITLTLSKQTPIESCSINDWGRYGNFEIFIHVKPELFKNTRKNVLTRQINKLVDDALKLTGAKRRETFSPEATRTTRYGRTEVTYNKSYWSVDIDFIPYHRASNTFAQGGL